MHEPENTDTTPTAADRSRADERYACKAKGTAGTHAPCMTGMASPSNHGQVMMPCVADARVQWARVDRVPAQPWECLFCVCGPSRAFPGDQLLQIVVLTFGELANTRRKRKRVVVVAPTSLLTVRHRPQLILPWTVLHACMHVRFGINCMHVCMHACRV
jgi:hypothetical protein